MAVRQSALEKVCWKWLQANLDHFRIDSRSNTVDIFKILKPFGELVLLAGINRHARYGSLRDLQEQLRTWLNQNRPNATALAEVAREFPQTFPWLGLIWQNLELIGLPDPRLRRTIERLLGVKHILHFERHVGHDICVHHIIESLGRRSPFDLGELYSRTMVAQETWDDPSQTAMYYICHDIFFMTNWGQLVLRPPLRPPRR